MSKNPTYWLPQSGFGYVLPQNGILFVTNLGDSIITNLSQNIIPTPQYVIGKYATHWSQI